MCRPSNLIQIRQKSFADENSDNVVVTLTWKGKKTGVEIQIVELKNKENQHLSHFFLFGRPRNVFLLEAIRQSFIDSPDGGLS